MPAPAAPQVFVLDPTTTLEECEAVARTQFGWTVRSVDVPGRRIEAVVASLLGRGEEVRIDVGEADRGGAVVTLSARRPRTIRRYQQALDAAVRARLQRREPGT